MKFSILIPVYNVKSYIKECIYSVYNQNFTDYEVVIIDDGSTDGSGKICDELANDVTRVIHKENEGLLKARRDAIKLARGEYCLFLDSDDKLEDNALDVINDEIIDSSFDLLIYNLFNWDYLNERCVVRKPIFQNQREFISENDFMELKKELLLTNNLNNMVIKAVKTSIIQNDVSEYDKYTDWGEDFIQTLYLFDRCKKIKYIDIPLYYYRTNPNSITNSYKNFSAINRSINKNIEEITFEYLYKWGLNTPENFEIICTRRLDFLRTVFLNNYLKILSKKERKAYVSEKWSSLIHENNYKYLSSKKINMINRIEIKAIINSRFMVLELYRLIRIILHRY